MKKWINQTTFKDQRVWFLGSMEEERYIEDEADAGWELTGPPVNDTRGNWVYYWKKQIKE